VVPLQGLAIVTAAAGAGDRHRHDVCIGCVCLDACTDFTTVCVACVGSLRNFYFLLKEKL
jgi:hypothetical protein